jgi:hypothetical protein
MSRTTRNPAGGRVEIAAPESMAANTAAVIRMTGNSPKSSAMVGQTQAVKKSGRASAGMVFKSRIPVDEPSGSIKRCTRRR